MVPVLLPIEEAPYRKLHVLFLVLIFPLFLVVVEKLKSKYMREGIQYSNFISRILMWMYIDSLGAVFFPARPRSSGNRRPERPCPAVFLAVS
jgi:hypothetical protein